MDYQKDIEINKYDLDNEWVRQPMLFAKYAEEYVKAMAMRDRLKEKLDCIEKEVELDVRNNPDKYDLPKVTEGAINAAVTLDDRVMKATEEYLEAVVKANTLMVAKTAMEHKKTALKAITQLMLSAYYQETNEIEEVLSEKIREKLNQERENNGTDN